MKMRDAASHLLLFMIANDLRDSKQYSIFVRALPFSSISDDSVRKLCNELKASMISIGMVPVGFIIDGEWNTIRTMGTDRPISVIQLLMDARKEATLMHILEIEKCLTINKSSNQPGKYHPAVPKDDVVWLKEFMEGGHPDIPIPFENAVHVLKRKQIPLHYNPYPWTYGKPDDKDACLKSIMAKYIYRYKIDSWALQDVDFINHPYFPEYDERVGEYFHEREDHEHVLKRFTHSFRDWNIPGIDLRRLVEALKDPNTGHRKQALTGERKQNVPDCGKVLAKGIVEFLHVHGYNAEKGVASVIRNWHIAVDGRGVCEISRSQYWQEMIDWMLSDWIPGYRNSKG